MPQSEDKESAEERRQVYRDVKLDLLAIFARKLKKNLGKFSEASLKTNSPQEISQLREYVNFLIKGVSESLISVSKQS